MSDALPESVDRLLQELVAIPSLSGQEGDLAERVTRLARAWGLEAHRHLNNVWIEVGRGRPSLLLVSHLDTVPPCEGWQGDPWKPRWREGRLAGLGANDAKGCVASLLWAARALAADPPEGRALFAFTAEEETGGARGIAELLPLLGPLDAALVGEPTGLQPCIAQRGMLVLRCHAKGEAAHVAHPRQGDNAIHKAARDIARLQAMAFEPHDVLGATQAQVTLVQGGRIPNQVPESCSFTVDLRTTPNLDHRELARRIDRELESRVEVHSSRYLARSTDAGSPVAQAAREACGGRAFIGSCTTSDWAFLGELPAVKIGPGDTFRSHRPDEFILDHELRAGAAFYARAARLFLARARSAPQLEAAHAG